MPEYIVERGIGETRMARVENDEIVEARVLLDGVVPAGTILRARLKQASTPAIAEFHTAEFLLPKGALGLTEGMALTIEVVREAIPGSEPWKRPLARLVEGDARSPSVPEDEPVPFPSPQDPLGRAGWLDLMSEARSGIVGFPGGELRVSPTPAMTLIDVDGTLSAIDLAMAGIVAAGRAIRRHGIGGSIGIDLPTVAGKAERLAIAQRFDAVLPQPFERTAVNGFGFLQVIRPRRHASMFELAADPVAFEARALLRAAVLGEPGASQLVAHPAVIALLEARPCWTNMLSRQLGGTVSLRPDPTLPISGGYAQKP